MTVRFIRDAEELSWSQVAFTPPPAWSPATVAGDVELDADGCSSIRGSRAQPVLSLWRAPTDNDRIGGLSRRWREWGLDALDRRLIARWTATPFGAST